MSLIYSAGFSPRIASRKVVKLNDVKTILGIPFDEDDRLGYMKALGFDSIQLYGLYGVFGNATKEAQLAAFIQKARVTYGYKHVGCIMGAGISGFQDALNYNASVPVISRFDDFNKENEFWNYFRVDFTVNNAVAGNTYSITLNGTTYSYVAGGSDTTITIASALVLAMAPSGLSITNGAPPTNKIRVKDTSSIYASFTYSNTGNISNELINESYTDWLNSLIWLQNELFFLGTGTISAYVANPTNNWGVTEATQMCVLIDYYEGTNYTYQPNEGQTGYRDNQLVYIAQGANNLGKIQKHYPIFSAEWSEARSSPPAPFTIPDPVATAGIACGEDVFMGYWLLLNNPGSVALGNSTWTTQYNLDPIPNKSNLQMAGYCWFSSNCLRFYAVP